MKARNLILLILLLVLGYAQAKANLSKDWISYFGYGNTKIYSIKFDPVSNHIYIVGTTSEKDLGTAGVHQPNLDISSSNSMDHLDVFIAKFTTAGQKVWFTYYGGSKMEMTPSMALDKLGNIYVSGLTESPSGIASPGAFKTSIINRADFIAKFDPQGQRLWGTYYNERDNQIAFGPLPAVDDNNNVYLLGTTRNTTGIATPGAFQTELYSPAGNLTNRNAYLVKFNASGQRSWGTYFGGGSEAYNTDIQTDPQNNIYIAGITSSRENITSPGAMVPVADSNSLSFLAKFNASGQRVWATYLHKKHSTLVNSIAVDAASNVYAFGITAADSGIATDGTWQPVKSGFTDFFLIKLNSSGHKTWGTYYGGEMDEGKTFTSNGIYDMNFTRNRIRLNRPVNPDIYVSGISSSSTGIKKGCVIPVDTVWGAVFSKFDPNGQLSWGSRYYSPLYDFDLGTNDSIYFVGNTSRNNLASSNAYQPTKPGPVEAGLFGKFVEHYACATNVTVPFSRVNDSLITPTGYLNYQWFRNDTLLQNGPQNYFILQGNYEGIYKLKVSDSCNCIFNSDTLLIAHPTFIKGTAHNTLELSVAPNPATHKLNVQLNNAGQGEFRFRIYNILGRKIFESDSKFDTENKKVIDLSNYVPGVYLLHVENSTGKAIVKFIRQ